MNATAEVAVHADSSRNKCVISRNERRGAVDIHRREKERDTGKAERWLAEITTISLYSLCTVSRSSSEKFFQTRISFFWTEVELLRRSSGPSGFGPSPGLCVGAHHKGEEKRGDDASS